MTQGDMTVPFVCFLWRHRCSAHSPGVLRAAQSACASRFPRAPSQGACIVVARECHLVEMKIDFHFNRYMKERQSSFCFHRSHDTWGRSTTCPVCDCAEMRFGLSLSPCVQGANSAASLRAFGRGNSPDLLLQSRFTCTWLSGAVASCYAMQRKTQRRAA